MSCLKWLNLFIVFFCCWKGKTILLTCVLFLMTIYCLTSEMTFVCHSSNVDFSLIAVYNCTAAFDFSLQSSFCSPYNTSWVCKLYVDFFHQSNLVRNHCRNVLFSGNRCTFVFSCMQIQQVLCVCVCNLSRVIYICMLWVPTQGWRPRVHYYWPRSIKTKSSQNYLWSCPQVFI